MITHEHIYTNKWFLSVRIMRKILSARSGLMIGSSELKGLMDISNEEKIKQQMGQIIQDFTDIFILAKRRVFTALNFNPGVKTELTFEPCSLMKVIYLFLLT